LVKPGRAGAAAPVACVLARTVARTPAFVETRAGVVACRCIHARSCRLAIVRTRLASPGVPLLIRIVLAGAALAGATALVGLAGGFAAGGRMRVPIGEAGRNAKRPWRRRLRRRGKGGARAEWVGRVRIAPFATALDGSSATDARTVHAVLFE